MTERDMEDLIAMFPSEFFPRHQLVLHGRQQSFADVGRFDLLFEDEFQTKVLMELKARPGRYEDANQLARYKDELNRLGETRVLMWLVAPLIARPLRDFLDHIGIEYSEIHEAEFQAIAGRHGIAIPEPTPTTTAPLTPPRPPRQAGGTIPAVLLAYNNLAARDIQAILRGRKLRITPPLWPTDVYYSCWRTPQGGVAVRLVNASAEKLACLHGFDNKSLANGGTVKYSVPPRPAKWREKLRIDLMPNAAQIATALHDLVFLTRVTVEEELKKRNEHPT